MSSPQIIDLACTPAAERALVGGKGAGLARLAGLGLPVPSAVAASGEARWA